MNVRDPLLTLSAKDPQSDSISLQLDLNRMHNLALTHSTVDFPPSMVSNLSKQNFPYLTVWAKEMF